MGDDEGNRILPLIYDAAENPALGPEVLTQIGTAQRAPVQGFSLEDAEHPNSNIFLSAGIDPVYERLYNEHYQSTNILLQRARPIFTPGRIVATHQICSDRELLATEYYNDFLRQQKDWFHVVGGCVASQDGFLSILNFIRGRSADHFNDREIQILESLMPHLQRAVRLHQVFAQNATMTECLDRVPIAAMLVNERGCVRYGNRAAQAILQRNDGLAVDRQGCLTSANRDLRPMIAAACRTAAGCGSSAGGSILIERKNGGLPYTVSLSPSRQTNPFSVARHSGAVVFIVDPESRRESIAEFLRRLYGLTPAEAALASLLAEGKDLNVACDELGIRRTTARTHLRHVTAKLGVRRQAELVSTILRTVGGLT